MAIELKTGKKEKNDLYALTEDIFDYILEKIETNIKSLRGTFPHVSENRVWETKKNTFEDFWILGFWPGMLWVAYEETNEKKKFRDAALNILNSLCTHYLAEEEEGIQKYGCFHRPEEKGVNESLIWGGLLFYRSNRKPDKK